jgi:hypothetical protein
LRRGASEGMRMVRDALDWNERSAVDVRVRFHNNHDQQPYCL